MAGKRDLRVDERPEAVSPDALRGLRRRGRPPKQDAIRDVLDLFFSALFTMPALAGYGEHWKLDQDEGQELASTTEKFILSLPDKRTQQATKFLKTWAPALALIMTLVVILYNRIQATRRMMHAESSAAPQRPAAPRPAPAPDASAGGSGGAGGTGAAPSPDSSGSRIRRYLDGGGQAQS